MIEQDEPLAVVYRRGAEGFSRSVLALPEGIRIPEADIELPLSAIYEGIAFEEA